MKTLITVTSALILFLWACKKEDSTLPFYDKEKTLFLIAEAVPQENKPQITFEISDSTFSGNNAFTYFLTKNYNGLGDFSIDGRYLCFAPTNKVLLNPAYIKYDFKATANLTDAKAYKIKFTETNNVQTIPYSDTATWVEISTAQFSAIENSFLVPVSDFSHAYFIAKKP